MDSNLKLGTTVLFNTGHHGEIKEGKVKQLSPNGNFVKIGDGWFPKNQVNVLDVLTEAKEKPEKSERPDKAPTSTETK